MEQILHRTPPDDIFLLGVKPHGRAPAIAALAGWRVMEVIGDCAIDLKTNGACVSPTPGSELE